MIGKPITRDQLEALVLLHGCFISRFAHSDEWHIRMKVPVSPYRDLVTSTEVCTWSKDFSLEQWCANFPIMVKSIEQHVFAGHAPLVSVPKQHDMSSLEATPTETER